MRIGNFKRLVSTDFKQEWRELVDRLAFTLNGNIESLFQALNQRLSLSDNLLCDVKNVIVIVDADGFPKTTTSFKVANPNIVALRGISVINTVNQTNPTSYPTTAVQLSFNQVNLAQQNNNPNNTSNNVTVIINHITGLVAGDTYRIDFIAWG